MNGIEYETPYRPKCLYSKSCTTIMILSTSLVQSHMWSNWIFIHSGNQSIALTQCRVLPIFTYRRKNYSIVQIFQYFSFQNYVQVETCNGDHFSVCRMSVHQSRAVSWNQLGLWGCHLVGGRIFSRAIHMLMDGSVWTCVSGGSVPRSPLHVILTTDASTLGWGMLRPE